jgi:glutamyl-tRNA synthetase
MLRLQTRIAPTPSGHLHLGNAWSFTLAWLAARARGGRVHLRIDDLDADRVREEHLDDIFASLRWLGLDWDSGPRDAADFTAAFSQRRRLHRYRDAVERLQARGHAYACACSRAQVRGFGGVYPGTCRDLGLDSALDAGTPEGPERSLRFRVPDASVNVRDADGGAFALHPVRDMGDFVIRRRNGDPAYQLASVIDDEDLGVNFVVRGLDLMPSTGAQLSLAAALDLRAFARARFWHHPLVLGNEGEKLSKSRGSESLAALRERFPNPAPIIRWFARTLDVPAQGVHTARDLLHGFDPARVPPTPLHLSEFWQFAESGAGDV